MICIWCRKRAATQDMYCDQCFGELDVWDKARINGTYMAARWRLGKSILELKRAIRADLPRWLKWLVRI